MNSTELAEYLQTRYAPKKIGGRDVSYHAMARMCERHIRAEWVLEALRTPPEINPEGMRRYTGPFASVFASKTVIITVGYGYRNDPRKSP